MAKSTFCGREEELGRLWREWKLATEAQGHTQVVVVLADNGLGKTRLVQEFFGRLSTRVDQPGAAGYWPDQLELTGDNLRVNPPVEACRTEHEPAFLWWGLRFAEVERRNAAIAGMDESLPELSAHLAVLLEGVRDPDRRRTLLALLGDVFSDVSLDALGSLIPHVGLAKTAANVLRKSWGVGREYLSERTSPSLGDHRKTEQISKSERIVRSIAHVLAARDDRLPICIFADDAHFSDADPDTVDLLRRLLEAARADRWPLLMVITHWRDRWNADASAVARWLKPQTRRIVLLAFDKLLAHALAPVLAEPFPRLEPAQTEAILGRADGNPQFLEEIIHFMKENEGLFQVGDTQAPLTETGLREVMDQTVERHHLNARRFRSLPPAARRALAIGGMQGQRLLQELTAEVCDKLGLTSPEEAKSGLAVAETPHNIIKREGLWAEFLQQLYREIATRDMRNIVRDPAAAQSAMIAALRSRMTDPGALDGLSPEDRLEVLGLAWAFLRYAPTEEDASLGAVAAVTLIADRFARHDYLGAGALAQTLVDTMRMRASD